MGNDNPTRADDLAAALVAAFPAYLGRCLAGLGVANEGAVTRAVDIGTGRLAANLADLLTTPASDQSRSPLELVREATLPMTAVLTDLGVPPARRDEWEISAQPADQFGLFPASSQELGEEVWQLHLQWGIEKAQLVAGVVPAQPADAAPSLPSVGVFGVPAERRAGLIEAVGAQGYQALVWRNPADLAGGAIGGAELVIVDVSHPHAHGTIRSIADGGVRVVATGEAIGDLAMPGLLALGAEEVVELGSLVDRLEDLLPRLA
jgi:hypothetical protein